MSVMWELNDPGFWGGAWIGSSAAADWSSFSTACGCTATDQVLDYMIQWLSALPATYGYYAADDSTLEPDQAAGLRAVRRSDQVGRSDAHGDGRFRTGPGHDLLLERCDDRQRDLSRDDADADAATTSNLAVWQSVQQSVTQDQRAATRQGTSSAFILQSFSFGDNLSDGEAVGACTAVHEPDAVRQPPAVSRQPASSSSSATMRFSTRIPKLILWYTYAQASQGSHWGDLTSVVKAQYPVSRIAARAEGAARRPASTPPAVTAAATRSRSDDPGPPADRLGRPAE